MAKDLSSLLQFSSELARHVGSHVKNHRLSDKPIEVWDKGVDDLVSELDLWADKEISQNVKKEYPTHEIISEETYIAGNESLLNSAGYCWVVDPIDGTTNFVTGLPFFCVSIGLVLRGERVLGVVYDPNRDELFSAIKSQGAFLNGEKIAVSQKSALIESVVSTGFPHNSDKGEEDLVSTYAVFLNRTRDIRRFGSAALDQCWVAAGRLDAFFHQGLRAWDVAAGSLIVDEAGGSSVNFLDNTKSFSLTATSFLFSNPQLTKEVLTVFPHKTTPKSLENKYKTFLKLVHNLRSISSALSLLSWDEQVFMPSSGAKMRMSARGELSRLKHQRLLEPKFKQIVEELSDSANKLTFEKRRNVEEIKRELDHALRLPENLVGQRSMQQSKTHRAWLEARRQNDFSVVSKELNKLLSLTKEYACCIDPDNEPYNVLLDLFERGANQSFIDPIFHELKIGLSELLRSTTETKHQVFSGEFLKSQQSKFCRKIVDCLGFGLDSGRFDETVHPFCSSMAIGDVRLAVRYDISNPLSSLMNAIHEAGHGIYEQNLNQDHEGTPLGESQSLGIHESQSLIWERQVARSRAFSVFLAKQVKVFSQKLLRILMQKLSMMH